MAKYNRTHYKYSDRQRTPTSFFKCKAMRSDRHYYDGEDMEGIDCKIPNGIRPKERTFLLWDNDHVEHENNWKQTKVRKQYEWHTKAKYRRVKSRNIRINSDDDMTMDQILFEDYGQTA